MPTLIDIFNNRPFQAIELTQAMETVQPQPTLLGNIVGNLFTEVNSWTGTIAVFKRERTMRLVPVSPIGAPPVEYEQAGGKMLSFNTRRLAKGTTVNAREVQGILQMPMFQAVTTMQRELANRAAGIRDDIELTHEHMRFGAIQGKVLDADGTTVLDDWYDNWDVPVPTAWNMHLNVDTTNLRQICDNIRSSIRRASAGEWVPGRSQVHALCGDTFFANLVSHPMVERLWLGWAAAAELRGEIADTFNFGGIVWHRYEGTPDGTFAIPGDEARLFPTGAGNIFQKVLGPAEFDPWINLPGQNLYTLTIPDRDRGSKVRVELYNYPLYMCTRPEVLQSAVMF